jgi:succinylglutamate desuccinylase
VLKNIRKALKKRGKFYIQTLNPLFNGRWRNVTEWGEKDDGYRLLKVKYNPYSGRVECEDKYITQKGTIIKMDASESEFRSFRLYTIPELSKMVSDAGMKIIAIYGSQKIPLEKYNVNSTDMIVIGEK